MSRNGGGSAPRTAMAQGLTPEEFDALLRQLDPDRERAGEIYEMVRRKLVRLFEWRGCAFPEDLADEAINRAARRMGEGIELQSSNPYGYFYGVAHLLYKETMRRASREHRALESGEWPPASFPEDEEPSDRRLEILRHCLEGLEQDQRELVLGYHQGENNIRNRKALADKMGIEMNALRIRVHRVRRKLEDCVQNRLNH